MRVVVTKPSRTVLFAVGAVALFTLPEAAWAGSGEDKLNFDVFARGVAASGNSLDGTEDSDKSGGVFGGALHWDHDAGRDRFGLDAASTYFAYSDAKRDDRWSNRIAGSYERDLSSAIALGIRADFTSRLATLESSSADQTQIRGQLTVSEGSHRVRLTGGWRWRDYRRGQPGSGDGVIAGLEYRYRIDKKQSLTIEARHETLDASIQRLDHRRTTIAAEYRLSPADRLDLSLGMRWRDWTYTNRVVGTGKQHDHSWTPSLGVSYEFAPDWFVDLDGEYIARRSNDPQYQENIKRGSITIRKRFRLLG